MRLSPHFDSREFRCRDGTPAPARYLRWARELCHEYLEPLRSEFGPVIVISGFRTVKHNREVGGAPQSMHLSVPGRRGAAADLRCARGSAGEWANFLAALRVPGLGRYPSSVHADNRAGHARW